MVLYHYGSAQDGVELAAQGYRTALRDERIALPVPSSEVVLKVLAGAAA